jgi:transposase
VPPAQLALVTLLQAYTGASDDEAIEALTMDRRWQLVCDCLDCERAPLGKGTLVRFRHALIAQGFDRRLIERTVALAERDRGVGPRQLRAALDSSPLWGAGRVEDTYNLLGHALRKALSVIARQQGRGLAAVAADTGAELVAGSSLKAALDLDWGDPSERQRALALVLGTLDAVEHWVAEHPEMGELRPVGESLGAAHQVRAQDVERAENGVVALGRGVARERRIAIEEAALRHGRQSRRQRIDGYKRQVWQDWDTGLVRAGGVTPANAPEASVTTAIMVDLEPQEVRLVQRHIDRGYLSSPLVRQRPAALAIYCQAWPVRNGERVPKTAFTLDWEQGTIRCPNAITVPFRLGGVVHFPAAACTACPLRGRCTRSAHGRRVAIHPDEPLLCELRARQQTPEGRAKLRERVAVEHTRAHVGHWQGRRARYRGLRNNLFDMRRSAVIQNLHVIARRSTTAQDRAA